MKKSAAAEEARDFFLPLCFAARKERGFRAPPKRAPETGASRDYQRGPQRRAQDTVISTDPRDGHEMLRLLLPPPRSLYASTGHSPHHPSREPVQPATARLPLSRDNFPRRTHGVPQAAAMSHRPLLPQAHPASIPLPPPGLREPEPPSQLLL